MKRLSEWLDSLFRKNEPIAGWIKLGYRTIYLLPTADGWRFLVLLLAIWVGAINYQLSLAYVLLFLLGSLFLLGIWHTAQQLLGLNISVAEPPPTFAGNGLVIPLRIEQTKKQARFGLAFLCKRVKTGEAQVKIDLLEVQGDSELWLVTTQRGWLEIPRIIVESRYPLGLFRAWSRLDVGLRGLVYPTPEDTPPDLPFIDTDGVEALELGTHPSSLGDLAGLRPYREGDTPKQIAWKQFARTEQLQTKLLEQAKTGLACHLRWSDMPAHMDVEQRLSRLCAWVLAAETLGHRYALTLPNRNLPLNAGADHQALCLSALALYDHV